MNKPPLTTLQQAEAVLRPFWPTQLKRQAYTLDHVQAFMDSLGNPQDTLPAIHIAGTSGKSSTAYYTAALLQQVGYKVGLMVSPHVDALNERVQISLQPLPEAQFCSELSLFLDLIQSSGITLTYAEILYSFAYWEFARNPLDYMVVETGLGGLLDATNVISRPDKTCVITDIGLDHTNILGNTLAQIARQKAGIIQAHNTVFCHRQPHEAQAVIEDAARQKRATLHTLPKAFPNEIEQLQLPAFQKRNFALALGTVQSILDKRAQTQLQPEQIAAASHIHIPSRMEMVQYRGKTIIFDGAHNPQKLQTLGDSVRQLFPGESTALLVAFVQSGGRGSDELVSAAAAVPHITPLVLLSPPNTDGHAWRTLDELIAAARARAVPVTTFSDPKEAMHYLMQRPEPVIVIAGSLYLHHRMRPLLNKK